MSPKKSMAAIMSEVNLIQFQSAENEHVLQFIITKHAPV